MITDVGLYKLLLIDVAGCAIFVYVAFGRPCVDMLLIRVIDNAAAAAAAAEDASKDNDDYVYSAFCILMRAAQLDHQELTTSFSLLPKLRCWRCFFVTLYKDVRGKNI